MAELALKIVTPEKLAYEGKAEKLLVRTVTGDIAVLPGHTPYVAPLGVGELSVTVAGKKRRGVCIGGMICAMGSAVTLLPAAFEWAEQIDTRRAEESQSKAQRILNDPDATDADRRLALARFKRASLRRQIGEQQNKADL